MPTLGEFNFGVGIDWTRFDRDLQSVPQRLSKVERAAVIKPQVDARQVEQFAQQTSAILRKIEHQTIRPEIKNARQAFQFFEQLEAKQRQLTQTPTTITIRSNADELDKGFTRLQNAAKAIGQTKTTISITADGAKEMEQRIAAVNTALASLKKNETLTLKIDSRDAEHANQVLQQFNKERTAAEARGAKINIEIDPTGSGLGDPNQQRNAILRGLAGGAGRGFLQGSGLGQGAILGAGFGVAAVAAAAATAGVANLTRAIGEATTSSIQYNANLQDTINAYEVYTKSSESAASAIQNFRRLAAISRATEPQTLSAGQQFLATTGGDVQRTQELVRLTVLLSEARPNIPFERIQQAMQQLTSGDFRAFEDGANVAFGTVNQLVKQGYSGIELYRKAVEQAGGSEELLAKNAQNFNAQITTFTSNAARINAALGRGLFEGVNQNLIAINQVIGLTSTALNLGAEAFGRWGAEGFAQLARLIPGFTTFEKLRPAINIAADAASERDQQLASGERQGTDREVGRARTNVAIDAATGALGQQRTILLELERQQRSIAAAAARVTAEYDKQLVPLRAQLLLINRPNEGIERRVLQANLRGAVAQGQVTRAEGSPELQGQVAGQRVILEHEQTLLDIRHRRAEMAEQLGQAEQAIAQKTAEIEIRAAERTLAAKQEQFRGNQEARQDALTEARERIAAAQEARQAEIDSVRDAATAAQEARRDSLDSLRDQISAQQEARQVARDAIGEEIQLRQEQRQAARDAFQEIADAARQAYQEERDAANDAHEAFQSNIREQIEGLQDADREATNTARHRSALEQQLADLESSDRARNRASALRDAGRAVSGARTGRELRAAADRFGDLRADQASEVKREAIEKKIAAEKAQEDRAKEQRAEQIRKLELDARHEQRAFDAEQHERDRAFQQEERARQVEQHAADRQAREQDRADKAEQRSLEIADRQARRTEEAELAARQRADHDLEVAERRELLGLERANRDQTKGEAAQIRAQEQADREATRAENREIRQEQEAIAVRRQELADAAAAIDLANDRAKLVRLQEQFDLEKKRLDLTATLEGGKDIPALATATDAKTVADVLAAQADNIKKIDDLSKAIAALPFQVAIANLEATEAEALVPLEIRRIEVEQAIAAARSQVDQLEIDLERLRREASAPGPGEKGFIGPVLPGASAEEGGGITGGLQAAGAALIQKATELGNSINEALITALNNADNAAQITDGITKPIADGLVNVSDLLGNPHSPSPVFQELGASIPEGLIAGIGDGAEVAAALTAMFDNAWAGSAPEVDLIVTEVVNRFGGSDATSLGPRLTTEATPAVGAAINQLFIDAWAQGGSAGVDALLDEVEKRFARIGDYIDSPRAEQSVERGIEQLFGPSVLNSAFAFINQSMEIYGNNAAVAFIDGYQRRIASWTPPSPVSSGSSGGAFVSSSGTLSGSTSSTGSSGGSTAIYGPSLTTNPYGVSSGDIQRYLVNRLGYTVGTPEYDAIFAEKYDYYITQGNQPPPGFTVTGRASGGPVLPNNLYRINEGGGPGEIMQGRDGSQYLLAKQSASIIPLSTPGGGQWSAGRGGGGGTYNVNLNIGAGGVSITGGEQLGVDHPVLQEFATEVLDHFTQIMLAHSKHSPVRAARDEAGGM